MFSRMMAFTVKTIKTFDAEFYKNGPLKTFFTSVAKVDNFILNPIEQSFPASDKKQQCNGQYSS